MNNSTKNTAAALADLLAFADEAGPRGLLRDLTPATDHEISVLCTLPILVEHLDTVRTKFRPLFDRFAAEAPTGAKLHMTEAFAPGNQAWRAVAEQVRDELFELMHQMQVISIYVARRSRVARLSFESHQSLLQNTKAKKRSGVQIVGANRPNDERVEDQLMVCLALMLDTFAEQEQRRRVDIMFDQIDAPIAARYAEALKTTRNVSSTNKTVHGWDPAKKARVSGDIVMHAEAPFPLDSRFLGEISVVGKLDPLVFAVDVVANSLWRHLGTLPESADLNGPMSVADWSLGDLVWGKGAEKGFDLF
jgi:hypothetical protein